MKIIFTASLVLVSFIGKAQKTYTIKYGDDKTYTFVASHINTYRDYDELEKEFTTNDNYFDFNNDSLIVHTVYKTDNPLHAYIYRKAIAAKDLVIEKDQNNLQSEGTRAKLVNIKIESKDYEQMKLTTYENDKSETDTGNFILLSFNEEDKPLAQQILAVLMDYFKKH